jgi:hypothetical protein
MWVTGRGCGFEFQMQSKKKAGSRATHAPGPTITKKA